MATKRGSKHVYTKQVSKHGYTKRASKRASKYGHIKRLPSIKESSRGTKRKRDPSEVQLNRETRNRLSSHEAFQELLNKWSNSNKAHKASSNSSVRNSKQNNIQLLKNELNKNKNKTMNLLSNNGVKVKRKFTFKGLGNPLGIKI